MIHTKPIIVSNKQINDDCWQIVLDSPGIASEVRPGQFIHVRITETNDPLLRRPFSVCRRIGLDTGTIGVEVLYKVIGRGTELMTALRQGDVLDIIGPLGHGFELWPNKKAQVLLAGGIGAAGLLMLGEEISEVLTDNKLELYILLGAETKKAIILEEDFGKLKGKVMISTDDGTAGYRGSAIELLKNLIDCGEISSDCIIYACGPESMLKALAEVSRQNNIPAQVLIERHMICGIGACFNCICKVNKKGVVKHRDLRASHMQFVPGDDLGYALVCKDGPVFNIEEVVFD